MGEREELLAERADLMAKNAAATSWGAAVGARHERIKGIDRALQRLDESSAPAQSAPKPGDEAHRRMVGILANRFCTPTDFTLYGQQAFSVRDWTDCSSLVNAILALLPAPSGTGVGQAVAINALDKIDAQMTEMRSLKGWRMNLIRDGLKEAREALSLPSTKLCTDSSGHGDAND